MVKHYENLIKKRKLCINKSKKRISNKTKPYKFIQIFNSMDELVYEISNSFKSKCEELHLPYESFRKSFANDGSKLYQGKKKKKSGDDFFEFVGWYAKKVD